MNEEGYYHLSSSVALTSFMSQVLGHWQNLLVPFENFNAVNSILSSVLFRWFMEHFEQYWSIKMKTIVPCVQMDTCLFHCTHFIYMEMKWCAFKLVCLFVLSSRDNERKIRIACVLGTFVEKALVALFGARGKKSRIKEMSSVTGSPNSYFGK